MKNKLIALFVTLVSLAFGQNQLYVNQITTSGNTTFVQVGSLNKVGSSQTPSNITGDNILFEMRQMGNNNTTDFSIIDANNLKLVSVFNGNTNTQKIFMSGANNNMNLLFNGNNNSFLLNKDVTVDHTSDSDTTKATVSYSDFKFNVTGSSNVFKFGIENGKYNYIDYEVTGSSNTIKSTQIGLVAGGSTAKDGHEQTVTITGGSNDLTIYQAGLEKQLFNYNLTGSNNTVRIVQTTTAYSPLMTLNTNNQNGVAGAAQTTATIVPPSN